MSDNVVVWICRVCGFRCEKPEGYAAVFHKCVDPRRRPRRRYSIPEVAVDRESTRSAIMQALLDVQGESSIWRPIEEEE